MVVEAELRRLAEVCSRIARPEHFTQHKYCDECEEADAFFLSHTPASLAEVIEPPETLPLAFLTPNAFRYMLPALVQMLVRDPAASDLLLLIEIQLDSLTSDEAGALRDALYAIYDASAAGFDEGFYAYEALWRLLDRLDANAS